MTRSIAAALLAGLLLFSITACGESTLTTAPLQANGVARHDSLIGSWVAPKAVAEAGAYRGKWARVSFTSNGQLAAAFYAGDHLAQHAPHAYRLVAPTRIEVTAPSEPPVDYDFTIEGNKLVLSLHVTDQQRQWITSMGATEGQFLETNPPQTFYRQS